MIVEVEYGKKLNLKEISFAYIRKSSILLHICYHMIPPDITFYNE